MKLGERLAAAWTFTAIPDLPPSISFAAEPKADAASLLELPFTTADDYGVIGATAAIEPDAEALAYAPSAQPFVTEPITINLPLPLTGRVEEAAETISEDLTRHVWAGLPVSATLTAEDEIGQTGQSRVVRFRLPQRRFYEPMAREAEAGGVIDLLWEAAIRIEEGDLSNAAERLRAAQRRLREAIRENAPQDEIARLMQELREALADFLNQMARQALENPESLAEMPEGSEMMDQQSLEDLLSQLEDAMRSGNRARAEQLLSQLQQILENLQMARRGQGQGEQGQGQQALRELQDLIGRQQGLADESFELFQNQQGQGQQGQPGQQQPGQNGQGQPPQTGEGGSGGDGQRRRGPGAMASEQEELRRLLDQLQRGLPQGLGDETGEALGRAGREMGEATDDLRADRPGEAVDDQVDALEALREGAEQLGEALREMARQQGGGDGEEGLDGPDADSADIDPLGRPQSGVGPLYGDSVHVPDDGEVTRSRELMDELRRRAGERDRPREELDYIDRLMEQF